MMLLVQLLKLSKKGISGEIINVGSGKPLQVKKVILKICRLISLGKPIFGKIKFRKDEIKYLYPSIKKANLLLNWTPKVKFNLGLKKTINDYKKINECKSKCNCQLS